DAPTLRDVGDPAAHDRVRWPTREVLAVEDQASGPGGHQPRDHAHEGRLARSVWPHYRDRLARVDPEAHVPARRELAVAGRDPRELEHDVRRSRPGQPRAIRSPR